MIGRPVVDLTGMVFGRLQVVSKVGINTHGSMTWLCQCVCGNEKVAASPNLRRGATMSCGCLRREMQAEINRARHAQRRMNGHLRPAVDEFWS